MTVEPGARYDPLAAPPGPGHRKATFGSGTLLFGQVLGQDAVKFFWDAFALWSGVFPPISEVTAAEVFVLLAGWVFYQTKEKS